MEQDKKIKEAEKVEEKIILSKEMMTKQKIKELNNKTVMIMMVLYVFLNIIGFITSIILALFWYIEWNFVYWYVGISLLIYWVFGFFLNLLVK